MKKIFPLFLLSFAVIQTTLIMAQNLQTVTTNGNTTTLPISVHNGLYLGRGTSTNASTNFVFGSSSSLSAAGSTAQSSIAVGISCLPALTSGVENVLIGHYTGRLLQSGSSYNSAVGYSAFSGPADNSNVSNITYNTAFGHNAMSFVGNNSTGNCAFGQQALKNIGSGKYNVGVGMVSGNATTGDSNTYVGTYAGATVSAGNGNTAIGASAGSLISTGHRNIAIGFRAQVQNNSGSNQLSIQNIIYGINNTGTGNTASTGFIGIGVQAPTEQLHVKLGARIEGLNVAPYTNIVGIDATGKLVKTSIGIGCSTINRVPVVSQTNGQMICSQIFDDNTSVGIGPAYNAGTYNFSYTWPIGSGGGLIGPIVPTTGFLRLAVDGVTQALAYYATSDERLKKNIKGISNSVDLIKKMRGVTYDWDIEKNGEKSFEQKPQIGFLAQELAKVVPEAVIKGNDGYLAVNYSSLIPVLTEGIKEQQTLIEELRIEVTELKTKVNQLTMGTELSKNTGKEYFEVVPNPFAKESKIIYSFDNISSRAVFVICDLQGKMLNKIVIPQSSKEGQLPLINLSKGMYILSLVIDTNEIQSKRFLVL